MSGLIAGLPDRIGPAVNSDQHRPDIADVGPERPEVTLVVGSPDNDQDVTVTEDRLRIRKVDGTGEQLPLFLDVRDRVLGEVGKGVMDLVLLPFDLPVEIGLQLLRTGCHSRPVALDFPAFDHHMLVFDQKLEKVRVRKIDQPDPGFDEDQRAPVRVTVVRGGLVVEDHFHPARDEILGRDPVDVAMTDHRDIARSEGLDQILGRFTHPDPALAGHDPAILSFWHAVSGPPAQPSRDRVHPSRVIPERCCGP